MSRLAVLPKGWTVLGTEHEAMTISDWSTVWVRRGVSVVLAEAGVRSLSDSDCRASRAVGLLPGGEVG